MVTPYSTALWFHQMITQIFKGEMLILIYLYNTIILTNIRHPIGRNCKIENDAKKSHGKKQQGNKFTLFITLLPARRHSTIVSHSHSFVIFFCLL